MFIIANVIKCLLNSYSKVIFLFLMIYTFNLYSMHIRVSIIIIIAAGRAVFVFLVSRTVYSCACVCLQGYYASRVLKLRCGRDGTGTVVFTYSFVLYDFLLSILCRRQIPLLGAFLK